jgi:tRNA (guanine-N7-)-methyltransferase
MSKKKLQRFAEFETFPNTRTYPTGMKGHWGTHFFSQPRPLVLELACGKGTYTVELAQRYPEKNFIGVDRKGARLWVGAKSALENDLHNAGFVRMPIELVDNYFGRNEVSEIWIPFPDPQPHKPNKRLTSPRFLFSYRKILQSDGRVHLKTDDEELYHYTLETVQEEGWTVVQKIEDVHGTGIDDPLLTIRTDYEKRHLAEGKRIKYVCFRRDTHRS